MRYLLIGLILFFTAPSYAVVDVVSVGDAIVGGSITIAGTGFGTKIVASPRYFNNFDSMVTGVAPQGWTVEAGNPKVSTTKSFSGSNAVEFINVDDNFQQLSRDVGELTTFVYHGKMYFDNSNDTLTSFQMKHVRISSSNPPYFNNQETSTAILMYDSWWQTSGWYNTGSPTVYYNGGTNGGTVNGVTDLYPFNQWFDYTVIATMSSADGVDDGAVYNYINGVLKSSSTSLITNDTGDGLWRYMLMGGTINNGDGGTENFKIYYDDVYVDDTQSRVELCAGSTWALRGICEPQSPTAWNDTGITATVNLGDMSVGDSAYLYVVDSAGLVNSDGVQITLKYEVPGSPMGGNSRLILGGTGGYIQMRN